MTQTCVTLIKSAECNQTAGSSSPSAADSPVSARLFKEKGERVKKEKKKKEEEDEKRATGKVYYEFKVCFSGWVKVKRKKKKLLGKRTQAEIEWRDS